MECIKTTYPVFYASYVLINKKDAANAFTSLINNTLQVNIVKTVVIYAIMASQMLFLFNYFRPIIRNRKPLELQSVQLNYYI